MTTLAELLRAVDVYDEHDCFLSAKLFGEAADDIERLNEEVRLYVEEAEDMRKMLERLDGAAREIERLNEEVLRLQGIIVELDDALTVAKP